MMIFVVYNVYRVLEHSSVAADHAV